MKFLKAGYWPKLLIALLAVIQLGIVVALVFLVTSVWDGTDAAWYFVLACYLIDTVTCIAIVNSKSQDIYKISWMVAIIALPFLGLVLYLLFANKSVSVWQKKKHDKYDSKTVKDPTDPALLDQVDLLSPDGARISKYLQNMSGTGMYANSEVSYLPLGDEAFPLMIRELKKAKHYIFMEYFIIASGHFWDDILEVLEEKAKEGLDVRVLYDDVGCISTLPVRYWKKLQDKGIKAHSFNRFRPLLDIRMNNRDHRKILVIDGHTCFTGGINIADEYINEDVRFGHWKDNAIMIKGDATFGFTALFLSNWHANYDSDKAIDVSAYRPSVYMHEMEEAITPSGFIQPYGEIPYAEESVGEQTYIHMISSAKRYVYIVTPYLIIDKELELAITNAAKSGVEVVLLTPHVPDKKAVFHMSRSYYGNLIKAGVKVYEYTPGFVHEKMFIVDDVIATVGTINLDSRSLYLHLECGTFMVGVSAIENMKRDFEDSIALSHQVSLEEWEKWHVLHRYYWGVLRILAPLL